MKSIRKCDYLFIRTIHLELNLMKHSNLWISRALDLTEGGCNLIFALGFKTSPRKTRDGNRTIAFMIPLCREALSVHILPWSHFPRPLTNMSRQSRFQHWQWSRRILAYGARILKISVPKTMYCLWETCLPHE